MDQVVGIADIDILSLMVVILIASRGGTNSTVGDADIDDTIDLCLRITKRLSYRKV